MVGPAAVCKSVWALAHCWPSTGNPPLCLVFQKQKKHYFVLSLPNRCQASLHLPPLWYPFLDGVLEFVNRGRTTHNLFTECSGYITKKTKKQIVVWGKLRRHSTQPEAILTELVWVIWLLFTLTELYCNLHYNEPVLQINNNLNTVVAVLHRSLQANFSFSLWTQCLLTGEEHG